MNTLLLIYLIGLPFALGFNTRSVEHDESIPVVKGEHLLAVLVATAAWPFGVGWYIHKLLN